MFSKGKDIIQTISLFPLPVVLFPNAYLPLHIFEERYKQLVNEAIENDEPFGVVFFDEESNEILNTGCSTIITKIKKLSDGKMNILTHGLDRFEIIEIIEKLPFMKANVKFFNDLDSKETSEDLVESVQGAVIDLINLSSKLVDKEVVLEGEMPSSAVDLSFWIAANFYGSPKDQQDLLEIVDTFDRLNEEFEILDGARKRLAAKVSLKNALG